MHIFNIYSTMAWIEITVGETPPISAHFHSLSPLLSVCCYSSPRPWPHWSNTTSEATPQRLRGAGLSPNEKSRTPTPFCSFGSNPICRTQFFCLYYISHIVGLLKILYLFISEHFNLKRSVEEYQLSRHN